MRKNRLHILLLMLIPCMCILEMFIHPITIRADDTFMAYCYKKSGEIFYEEEFKSKSKQFDPNDIEVIFLNVKPCRKFKKNMTEEEANEKIPVAEAITCLLVEKYGLKFFRNTEEYPNGKKKTEYTGYGTSKYLIEYKHGKLTEWYETGQKKHEVDFKFGSKEGKLSVWYKNGAKQSKANLVGGKLNGVAKTYYQNGGLMYKDTFKNGEKINRKAYDKEGKLNFNQDY